LGTDLGLAVTPDTGLTWTEIVSNPNNEVPDDTNHIDVSDTTETISGNFITALAVGPAPVGNKIWASTQQTSASQTNGVSVSSDNGRSWSVPLTNIHAWNFAFFGADESEN